MIIHSSNINLTQSNYSNNTTNTCNDPMGIKLTSLIEVSKT